MKTIKITHDESSFAIECTSDVHFNDALAGEFKADDTAILTSSMDKVLTVSIIDERLDLEGEEWAVSQRTDATGSFVYLECPDNVMMNITSDACDDDTHDDDAHDERTLILEAIDSLDETNDDHWTKSGLPAMTFIESIAGEGVTRKQLEEISDITRESLIESTTAE